MLQYLLYCALFLKELCFFQFSPSCSYFVLKEQYSYAIAVSTTMKVFFVLIEQLHLCSLKLLQ